MEHAGKSILEMLWEQAVIVYGNFKELHEDHAEDRDPEQYYTTKGKLQGIAYAIAKLLNPAKPNLEDVKKQIKEQWEAEQEDEDE